MALLVFIHDDVWIDDYFPADRVIEGLRTYDVIGVAGNRRKVPRQPGWAFSDSCLTWDDRAHRTGPNRLNARSKILSGSLLILDPPV